MDQWFLQTLNETEQAEGTPKHKKKKHLKEKFHKETGVVILYGVDEISEEDISLIDLETGLPIIVDVTTTSKKANIKEGDKIKGILTALDGDGSHLQLKQITKI